MKRIARMVMIGIGGWILLTSMGILCAQSAEDPPPPMRLEDLTPENLDRAATPDPADRPVTASEPRAASEPTSADPRYDTVQRAIDFRRRMLQDGTVPVTPPKGEVLNTDAPKSLPKEGSSIAGRVGWIARDSEAGWYAVTFRNTKGQTWQAPRRLLPNRLLEGVEDILRDRPDTLFLVHGETTVFQGDAYLLLLRVAVYEGEEEELPPMEVAPSAPAADAKDTADAPQTPEDDKPSGELPSTDELADLLQKDKTGRAVSVAPAPPREQDANTETVAPAESAPLSAGSDSMIVDRTVRIVQDEKTGWWEVHFIADNTLREPPMRVLPNQMLQRVQSLQRILGNSDLKVRVTGETTYYRGLRFILLRKVLRERDMNQF
jgi:hypothetical protein